jgi:hypothetical protein
MFRYSDLFNTSDVDADVINASGLNVTGDIQVSGYVDGVDISVFKGDYDSKINQKVRTDSAPTFSGLKITGLSNGIAMWSPDGLIRGDIGADNTITVTRTATSYSLKINPLSTPTLAGLVITGRTSGLACWSAGGIGTSAITGTTDQIVITPTGTDYVFSLPQSIAVTSTPTFSGLKVTGLTSGVAVWTAGGIGTGTLSGTTNQVIITAAGNNYTQFASIHRN